MRSSEQIIDKAVKQISIEEIQEHQRHYVKEIVKMEFLEKMDQRVKKLGIVDLKLAQGAAMCVALIIAKLAPQIMEVSVWWFVVLLIGCAMRPVYVFWFDL